MTWPRQPLGELCRPKQWKALPKSRMTDSGYPVYGANGVIGFAPEFTHVHPTVLVGCRGSIGAVHLTTGRAYATSNTMALDDLRTERIDPRFLARFLSWRGFRDVTSGTSQPQLTRQNMLPLEVPVPPLDEQRRIAAVLDHADALRSRRRQVLTHLDSLIQSTFIDMFARDVGRGRVPLSALASLVTKGTTPTSVGLKFSSDGVPFLRAQNLQGGTVVFGPGDLYIDADTDLALKRSRIVPNDLLISIAGTIGRVALVPEESPTMNCNQAVAVVRLIEPDVGPWLRAWLASSDALSQIGASAVTGTISNLSLGQIRQLQVPVVDSLAIEEFNRRVARVETTKDAVAETVAREHELFSSLQSRAFREEL